MSVFGVHDYNYPTTTIEGDIFVTTAFMPGSRTRPAGYLGFEIDADGLPLPDARGVQPVGVMDYRPEAESSVESLPLRPRGDRPEHHFRLGGASAMTGVAYPRAQRFAPIDTLTMGELTELTTVAQPLGEAISLGDTALVATGLMRRDRYDINSWHNPRRLADHSSQGAVQAAFVGRLLRPAEVEQELDFLVNDPTIWQHIQNPNRPDPASFMNIWQDLGIRGSVVGQKLQLTDVVSAMIRPEAEAITSNAVQNGGPGDCPTCAHPVPHLPRS